MYEMITGEELFQSDSDYGYLQKHVNEEPEFPASVKDKMPSFYKNLILKCLFKERVNRYQDCSGICRDFRDRLYSKGTFISEIERSIKKTGPLKIGLSLLLILVISFIGSLILEKGPPSQKNRSVAILYFKNFTGIKKLDHFSYSIPELLMTDLGQSKYIKVLPEDKVSKILQELNYLGSAFIDEKMFEDLGNKPEVNYLVQGSFIKSGGQLRIAIKLRDSETGEILSSDFVDTPIDNIFPAIDRLTTGLKRKFNLTENEIFTDIDSDIETITTSSQEALNFFITGKRLFNEGKFEDSLVEYQKAIYIDPEFAMAYRNMAWSYAYLHDWEKRKKYFEKTIQYVDNLSTREKYLIFGGYYSEEEITFQ
ncbi:MAG: tetratricopeptide repeat protein, partial [Candidatus Aminicenantes bacterium]|nr:tetratricopeptide repeat protein [Candidatus Aminicenantes bacterium]